MTAHVLAGAPRRGPRTVLLVLSVPACALLAALFGAVDVGLDDWIAPLHGELDGSALVLWQLRLPRIVFACLVGAALGLAGALTQALFRNPLSDPGLLGVTGGGACAVALSIVLLSSAGFGAGAAWRPLLLPACAFAGAFVVCVSLDRLARWLAPGSIVGLLLTGIGLNALTAAIVGLCTFVASDEQLRSLSFWTLGSLAGASLPRVAVLAVALLVCVPSIVRLGPALNALALGEQVAAHSGVDVQRLRTRVVLVVAVLSGVAVSWCGVIGFVGLIAPHVARRIGGADQRSAIPASALTGALLVLLADTLARSVAIPAEVPVGIFTALLGGPFFLSLIAALHGRRSRR